MSAATIQEIWGGFRDMTEADVCEAVAELPDELREALACGPHPRRFTCGVCNALGVGDDDDDPKDAVVRVRAYHEVPKLDMRTANDQWYGELANEVYRRCLAIYRAAGWAGEASEPDA